MKRIIAFVSFLILFPVFQYLPAMGQHTFEGIIRYKISIPADSVSKAPEGMEYYLKENNLMLRIFLKNEDELARILFLGDEKTLFMIDDIQKTAMKIRMINEDQSNPGSVPDEYKEAYEKAIESEQLDEMSERYSVVETDIIENIAGYPCKKYQVNNANNQGDTFVWITEEIAFDMPKTLVGEDNPLFRFIGKSGFPLKLKMFGKDNGVIEMQATRIESIMLKSELFIIPSDYLISDISSFIQGN